MRTYSVLEQFEILPIINTYSYHFIDFTITNQTIMLVIILAVLFLFYEAILYKDSIRFVPPYLQVIFEAFFKMITSVIVSNIGRKNGQRFFPLIVTVFIFVLLSNMIGLIPYSFTITSHFIVTFGLSIYLFLGIVYFTIKKHKLSFFELFLPSGTPVPLALILVPVEIISYVFKPISLSIRLFANMMAGHTLLKVIAWFGFALMQFNGVLFLLHFIPILLLLPLFLLELAVALIQALVFSILISIYINEAVKLH